MKRRHALLTMASLPALAQKAPTPASDDHPKLATTAPDGVVAPAPHFFTPLQLTNLRKLAALLVPPAPNRPGAIEAGAPEFLDFLIEESPSGRQALYRHGLDRLETAAHSRFGKGFAELSPSEAAPLLAVLETPWTYEGPQDELDRFLAAAKDDILRATMNSRPFVSASGRRGGGIGTYWLPIE